MAKLKSIKIRIDDESLSAIDELSKSFEKFAASLDPSFMEELGEATKSASLDLLGMTEGEELGSEIELLKKTVLNHYTPAQLHTPTYNRIAASQDARVRQNEIEEFIQKFAMISTEICVTGRPSETEYDRHRLNSAVQNALVSISANKVPLYGCIILQPPNLDGQLSLGYVDDFLHLTFNQNCEEFTLEGINAELINLQPPEKRGDMMIFVREILASGAYLEFLNINLYNCIGTFIPASKKHKSSYYKNTVNSILNEWKE